MRTSTTTSKAELSLLQELRRGTLILAVLSTLRAEEACGAEVRSRLAEVSLPIEDGALYPMLRRLEEQELLQSNVLTKDSRQKRVYRLVAGGETAHRVMMEQWSALALSIERLNGERA
jgi:PadR family transcriptional regulator, regulatory protein PadR